MNNLEYFIEYIFPPFVLGIGLIGNIAGFIVMRSRKLEKVCPRVMYQYMFTMDALYLIQILFYYLALSYGKDITIISELSCKIYNYFNYSLCPISPMLLCYISFDRFIAIRSPSRKFIIRKVRNQFIYLMTVFTFNAVYYIPISFEYSIIDLSNETNATNLVCDFFDSNASLVLSWLDLANYVMMPFILMVIFSFLIICTIFQSRRTVFLNRIANRNLNRDIKFSLTCLILNILYLTLNMPNAIINLFSINYSNILFSFTYYLFFLSYAVNFYIVILTNTKIRKQFFTLFSIKLKIYVHRRDHSVNGISCRRRQILVKETRL
jgi:hypothetical protein